MHVFLVKPGTKVPLIEGWQTPLRDPQNTVKEMLALAPDHNIGVCLPDGFIIDVDCKNGKPGLASLETLRKRGLPDTFTQRTPSGGFHLFFRSKVKVPQSAGTVLAGIDVRSSMAGYVVGAGSRLPNGEYSVEDDAPIADAPDWLVELLVRSSMTKAANPKAFLVPPDSEYAIEQVTRYLKDEAPEAIQDAGGDATTIFVAECVRDWSISEGQCFDLMAENWNDEKAIPPWDLDGPNSLRTKVRNAFKYAKLAAGNKPSPALAEAEFLADEQAMASVAKDAPKQVFRCDAHNVPVKTEQANIRLALAKMGVQVRYDQFRDRISVKNLPGMGPTLDDSVVTRLWLDCASRFRFLPTREFFLAVVEDTARRNAFHPVRDYLAGLIWDGERRIDSWLPAYGGAPDTPYVRAVGALIFVAAVRRVRQPGCKFDEMPVFEGDQGTDKSSALEALAVHSEWFSDDLPLNVEGKRVVEAIGGRWIVEAAELSGMKQRDVEGLKALLSRNTDHARMSYARIASDFPRQCIFVGTTNNANYLKDGTGNRRYWPVSISRFDLPALRRDRDQLWAEAAAREAAGASIRLDPALWAAAASEQRQRVTEDPFVYLIEPVLGRIEGKIRTADLWALLQIPKGQQTQTSNARLGDVMKQLGWKKDRLRFGGDTPEYCYVKGGHKHPDPITIDHLVGGVLAARIDDATADALDEALR